MGNAYGRILVLGFEIRNRAFLVLQGLLVLSILS